MRFLFAALVLTACSGEFDDASSSEDDQKGGVDPAEPHRPATAPAIRGRQHGCGTAVGGNIPSNLGRAANPVRCSEPRRSTGGERCSVSSRRICDAERFGRRSRRAARRLDPTTTAGTPASATAAGSANATLPIAVKLAVAIDIHTAQGGSDG